MKTNVKPTIINGIDTDAVRQLVGGVAADPARGATRWQVASRWQGGTRSDAHVSQYMIGGETVPKNFVIRVDEPLELGGTNQYANPQETLLAALNACMIAHYAIAAAMHGVELETLTIETEGDIDLRGFLGLDPDVKAGYDSLSYTVRMAGNGTPEQMEAIHATVTALSPNRFNIANAIRLDGRLVVEQS
ncbi:MAG: OsmC family protein [Candidatus Krumholzibacteriia bacterium]